MSDPPFHMREPGENQSDTSSTPGDLNHEYIDIGDVQSLPRLNFSQWQTRGKGLMSSVKMTPDGRMAIALDLKEKLPDLPTDNVLEVEEDAVDLQGWRDVPKLQIVIQIVGSRGDVQPYVALGKQLKKDGHRVRIATHETFHDFVKEHGLEFFSIGGNPHDLMSYMVKNPGLIPGMESLTNGDIGRKRTMLNEMIQGCWRSCHSPDPDSGTSFAADAIISNPPAFAHIHCAEALGIPLLMSFTMPWCSTAAFKHPLVNISESNAGAGLTNVISYALADILTWQGVGDIVNKFRAKQLGLHALSLRSGPGVVERCKVPWTYCMSPGLVPKPQDWMNNIDVVGFYFLDLATSYTPPSELADFLAAGDSPIYIGFGSVVVDDSAAMTKTIFEATERAGVRALVSAGWGGLGGVSVPPHIFILGNVPHDWLFSNDRVKAVIHHGGAGTTAIGLAKGRPTAVVPFFGDQAFWGSMIHKAGAGPEPIHHKKLDADNLTEAIQVLLSPSTQAAAKRLAEGIQVENGLVKGVESFYQHLPLLNMRCDLQPERVAAWWSTEHCLKLSAFAAQVLVDAKKLQLRELEPHRSREYETRKKVTDPVTGGSNAIFWTVTHYYAGIAKIFYSPVSGIIQTTVAIPKGIMKIVTSVHEGFHNVPKIYGSDVREKPQVKNLLSGFKEAGKSVFYGYYDGITGLYKEPIAGAKKEGFMGFVKGSGRSYINATMKPAAGILGAIVHPLEGAWQQGQATMKAAIPETAHQVTRRAQGIEEAANSQASERRAVLERWERATGRKELVEERRKKVAERVEKAIQQDQDMDGDTVVGSPSLSSSSSSLHLDKTPQISPRPSFSDQKKPSPPLHPSSAATVTSPEPTASLSPEEEEAAAFQRDLELAKQLSTQSLPSTSEADTHAHSADDEDAEFQRQLEEAKQLSLADR